MARLFFILGSSSAFIAVAAGAFGAHALRNRISPEAFNSFEVGVRYQMYHALALLAVSWAITRWPNINVSLAGWFFVVGTFLFSGSLYALSLTGMRLFGVITPLGGVLFLLGWLYLGWSIFESRGL